MQAHLEVCLQLRSVLRMLCCTLLGSPGSRCSGLLVNAVLRGGLRGLYALSHELTVCLLVPADVHHQRPDGLLLLVKFQRQAVYLFQVLCALRLQGQILSFSELVMPALA